MQGRKYSRPLKQDDLFNSALLHLPGVTVLVDVPLEASGVGLKLAAVPEADVVLLTCPLGVVGLMLLEQTRSLEAVRVLVTRSVFSRGLELACRLVDAEVLTPPTFKWFEPTEDIPLLLESIPRSLSWQSHQLKEGIQNRIRKTNEELLPLFRAHGDVSPEGEEGECILTDGITVPLTCAHTTPLPAAPVRPEFTGADAVLQWGYLHDIAESLLGLPLSHLSLVSPWESTSHTVPCASNHPPVVRFTALPSGTGSTLWTADGAPLLPFVEPDHEPCLTIRPANHLHTSRGLWACAHSKSGVLETTVPQVAMAAPFLTDGPHLVVTWSPIEFLCQFLGSTELREEGGSKILVWDPHHRGCHFPPRGLESYVQPLIARQMVCNSYTPNAEICFVGALPETDTSGQWILVSPEVYVRSETLRTRPAQFVSLSWDTVAWEGLGRRLGISFKLASLGDCITCQPIIAVQPIIEYSGPENAEPVMGFAPDESRTDFSFPFVPSILPECHH
ncbi:MAG: uncharacterized protein KVP18_005154 [Porospora cf. gigantea A]|uniref:uncharacterized protein n=1 Tax=Porospora cf. gigantea A TaxID=2853593 RepID=UPI00355AC2D3|nr:MAG: hypothetical protein KVP18_005154 [Porospora cf. gigantea A]